MYKKLKKLIYGFTKKILPEELFKKFVNWCHRQKFISGQDRYLYEYYISKKRNANEKYCIFRCYTPPTGVLSTANVYIFMYEWAIDKGYIPIMDMEFEYDFMNFKLGEDNVWEDVFEQPLSVKDVLKKDWVLVKRQWVGDAWLPKTCLDINGVKSDIRIHTVRDNWREYYSKVNTYTKKCWNFRKDLIEEFENEYSYVFKEENVLGVALREPFSVDADKIRKNPNAIDVYNKHPKVMGLNEIVEVIKEYIIEHNCSTIFVSTMYEESINLFKDVFGDKVVYVNRERQSLDKLDSPVWGMTAEQIYNYYKEIELADSRKDRNVTYVKEVLALSRCDYLIGAPCGASIAALSINGGKYKDVYILPDINKDSKWY